MTADPTALSQPSDRTRESPFEAVLGTQWQTTQVTSRPAQKEGLNSCGALRREEKGTQDVGIKGQEPSSQRAFHLGSSLAQAAPGLPGRQPPPREAGR